MKKTLNQIMVEYVGIENYLIDSGGEITDDIEEMLEINELELGDKLDGYEGFIRHLKGQVSYLKEQENHFKSRRMTIENSVKNLKGRMVFALGYMGVDKIKTESFNFSVSESSSWKIDVELIDSGEQGNMIADYLATVEFTPSISAIKKYHESTPEELLPSYIKIERKKGIRVR